MQTINIDEVFLVDDSPEQRISCDNNPVKILRTGGLKGPSFSRNLAMSCVTGDWIFFIDDDDYWTENHVSNLLSFVDEKKLDAAYSSAIVNGSKRPKRVITGKVDPLIEIYSHANLVSNDYFLPTPGLIIAKAIAEHLPFNNLLREREDLWFAHKIFEYQFRIQQSNDHTVIVHQSRKSYLARTNVKRDLEWSERLELIDKKSSLNFLKGVALRNAILRFEVFGIIRIVKRIINNKYQL